MTSQLVDTHCHLDAAYFPEGAEDPIQRARSAGVGAFVCVGVGGLKPAEAALELAERRSDVLATCGIHPHDAAEATPELEARLAELLDEKRAVAVGEVGLDYHYDRSPRDLQRDVFRRFIALARTKRKPIVVHTRSAALDTLEILRSERAHEVGGIIHCFSEDKQFARGALDLGFYLSFSGIVTFKSAESVREVVRFMPEERLLVETDSPYLAPVPLRGKKCEPAYIVHTARCVAALKSVEFERIAELTSRNSCRLFGPMLAAALSV
jgi:TatD DNase family protein